jgi:putative flippase GtrA
MFDWKDIEEWKRIFRFYQAGLANAVFGYGAYAIFVALGMNIYAAQIVAHLSGMAFNFLTYSRYVFRSNPSSIPRYFGAYTGQYILSFGALAAADMMGLNPYMAGFAAIVFISMVNYLVLRFYVYKIKRAE